MKGRKASYRGRKRRWKYGCWRGDVKGDEEARGYSGRWEGEEGGEGPVEERRGRGMVEEGKERKGKGGGLGLCQPPIIPSGLLDFFYGWPPKQGLIKKGRGVAPSLLISSFIRAVHPPCSSYPFVYLCVLLYAFTQSRARFSSPYQHNFTEPYHKFALYI